MPTASAPFPAFTALAFDPQHLHAVGRIVAGEECGCHVQVVPDGEHYMVYVSRTPDMADPFDAWMYDMADIQAYFALSRWQVAWPTDADAGTGAAPVTTQPAAEH